MKTYQTICFNNEIDWNKVPVGKVDFFNWESTDPYRPYTEFQLCFKENEGVFVKMKTDEQNLRIVCRGRDENCWEDSCMEFFFLPFSEEDGYINFEMTPTGAYLSAFGKGRENRQFLREITDKAPEVNGKISSDGWEISLFIPCALVEDVFRMPFSASDGTYKGNFYKCGDLTDKPHYASYSPMGELPPGFHNSKLFADISVIKEY